MIVDLTSLIYCRPKFTMRIRPNIRYCNYIRNYLMYLKMLQPSRLQLIPVVCFFVWKKFVL